MPDPRPDSSASLLLPEGRGYTKRLSRTYLLRLLPWLAGVYVLLMVFILGFQLKFMHDELVHRGQRIATMYALTLAPPLAHGEYDVVRHILGTTSAEKEITAAEVISDGFRYVWDGETIRPDQPVVTVPILLPLQTEPVGTLKFYLTQDIMMHVFWGQVANALVVMALLLLTVVVITLRTQRRTILIPLNRLLEGIRTSSRDRRHQDIPVTRDDEIGALTRSYNSLMRRLVDLLHNLEQKVAEQTQALRRANARLERLAITDGLTGLANRRRFDEILEREWKRLARTGRPLSLILCDIDHFKKYNDRYGHQQGDVCLRDVAEILAALVKRPSDLPARYGGEEFAVILPETDQRGAAALAEEIRVAVERRALPHEAVDRGLVTLSLGCATLIPEKSADKDPAGGKMPDLLIRQADEALYASKEQGRNRTSCAGAEAAD